MTNPRNEVFAIASGAAISTDPIYKQHLDIVGFYLPTLTGTTFSFTASIDGTNFGILQYEGTVVTIAKTNGNSISVNPAKFSGWPYIHIVADDGNEGAARVITPVYRDFTPR